MTSVDIKGVVEREGGGFAESSSRAWSYIMFREVHLLLEAEEPLLDLHQHLQTGKLQLYFFSQRLAQLVLQVFCLFLSFNPSSTLCWTMSWAWRLPCKVWANSEEAEWEKSLDKDGPAQALRCGQSASVMTSKHAGNRSHPTFCKSLQCDFPSLVFSECEMRSSEEKRGIHKYWWSVTVERYQSSWVCGPVETSLSILLLGAAGL